MKMIVNEKRVYRQIALPVSAFDVLQQLKRAWGLETNGETLTKLLLTAGTQLMKNDERCRQSQRTDG